MGEFEVATAPGGITKRYNREPRVDIRKDDRSVVFRRGGRTNLEGELGACLILQCSSSLRENEHIEASQMKESPLISRGKKR